MDHSVFQKLSEDTDLFYVCSRERFLYPMQAMLIRQGVTLYTLTVPHHKVLQPLIAMFRGQWVSMKVLSSYAKGDRGNLSRAIYELEQMGLIELRSDTADRRVKYVRLTEKGEQIIDEGNRQSIALSEAYYRKYLTDSEIDDMHNCLSKVNAYWQKLQPQEFFKEK